MTLVQRSIVTLVRRFAPMAAVLAAACGGGDAVHGTWSQPNGQITVPQALGGGTVQSANTLVFDDTVSPATFDLKMVLSFQGLSDTLEAKGTYKDNGGAVALDFTGFAVASGSGDVASIGNDGSQCITLTALAGAQVCFQTQQTDSYQLQSNVLTVGIVNEIVGGTMGPTTLTLNRAQ